VAIEWKRIDDRTRNLNWHGVIWIMMTF